MEMRNLVAIWIRIVALFGFVMGALYFIHVFLKTGIASKEGVPGVFRYIEGIDNPYALIQPAGILAVWFLLFIFSGGLAAVICRGSE